MLKPETRVGARWKLTHKLAEGSFGLIFVGEDDSGVKVAVKMERQDAENPQLLQEAKLAKALSSSEGFG